MAQNRNLHITIGSSPATELNLQDDMAMVKAALLYGDQVKLCSPTSSMMLMLAACQNLKPDQVLEILEPVVPVLVQDPGQASNLIAFFHQYKRFGKQKRHLSKQELLLRVQLQSQLAKTAKELQATIERMLIAAGFESLIEAIQTGMLELHVFGADGNTDTQKMVTEFVEILSQAVSNDATYPLFDNQTGGLIKAGIKEGKFNVSDAGVTRGKRIGLAAALFDRLPLFEQASVDEILDIRTELENPLTRFRAAIINFSDSIKNAAWDDDFPSDADTVFQRDIEPAILDIESAVQSNSYFQELVRKTISIPSVASGAVLGVLMSHFSDLPNLVSQSVAGGVGAAGTVAVAAWKAYDDWKQKNKDVENNQLFFYYETKRRLSELHE
jgi:hypothetical protein